MGQTNIVSDGDLSHHDHLDVPPGALDGVTIMRYAHIYRDRISGGVEQYLRRLNQGLLQRHRLTVLQTYLTRDGASNAIEVENIGLGRILWIPVPVSIRHDDSLLVDLPARIAYVYSQMLRLCQEEGKGSHHALPACVRSLLRYHSGHLWHKSIIFSDRLPALLTTHKVDLLVLHWLTYDTEPLIQRALLAKMPFVFINHFDNARLSLPFAQKWLVHAAAIGCVSGQNIPEDLQDKCVNLSDAVDTDFFSPEMAQPVQAPKLPFILLPARIHPGKGHQDLIEAARILFTKNHNFVLCFAGAVDSEPLHQELLSAAAGIEDRVLFLREKTAEEMRNWYARSSMVVLPSYSEGLPRVLLEAQAMKKPIVAYDCGGISQAVLAGETGFLIKKGDVEALADKIAFLLQNESEGLRMGERGREFVTKNFAIPALIQRHEAFYLRAL